MCCCDTGIDRITITTRMENRNQPVEKSLKKILKSRLSRERFDCGGGGGGVQSIDSFLVITRVTLQSHHYPTCSD